MAQTNGHKDQESALMQYSRKSDDSDLEQPKDQLVPEESTSEKSSSKLNWRNVAKLGGALVLIALIITFAVLVFTTKTPRFQLTAVTVDHLNSTTSPNPFFNMRLTAHMTVHNPNYGYFSYGMTIVNLAYRGVDVGQVWVSKARINGVSTRRIITVIELNSDNVRSNSILESDIRSGFLTFTSHSQMSGKIYVMSTGKSRKVIGRRRTAAMNCTFTVNLAQKFVQAMNCS
ncbi:hypothetical protein COLO4_30270 [Corchorus olitorius]|uniref:Late embryogenesis abundant protein, LEA-14 n=1 Tax=Corchorus olitorius TaxID=93759 RepID=A0A1R3H9G4_9ROSI|nr:hypothetical protein COLO4_30270 [Corchorus olitorius]